MTYSTSLLLFWAAFFALSRPAASAVITAIMLACILHNINVSVENGVLTVEGRIDFAKYDGLQPVYTEYNIGPYRRSFRLSGGVDQDRISAEMRNGVIILVLPKSEEAKPRRIEVRTS